MMSNPTAIVDKWQFGACSRTFVVAPALNGVVATTQIGAAVVFIFMVRGSSVRACDFPATDASIMSARSCAM